MADDLVGNLQAYKLQLQQVEAALTTEQGNEDLLKLKKDLTEVLELTHELVRTQTGDGGAGTVASDDGTQSKAPSWKVGDRCMAVSATSGQYEDGTISEITESGQCMVSFGFPRNPEITTVALLKAVPSKKRPMVMAGTPDDIHRSKKQIVKEQREYKKKKAHKKAQRMKEIEVERETEKGKWQTFNTKAFSKNKKGHVKKSIFASPDNVNGRVGVGTCGIGGKPMTDYHHQEKWKK